MHPNHDLFMSASQQAFAVRAALPGKLPRMYMLNNVPANHEGKSVLQMLCASSQVR
jgi:hypothetical protein